MNPQVPFIVFVVVLVPVYRDPPSSSTFRAAPAIDTTGEEVPVAKVIPLRRSVAA